jgi:hypothetical protein
MEENKDKFEFFNVSDYFSLEKNKNEFLCSLESCYKNPSDLFKRICFVNNNLIVLKNELQTIGYLFFSDIENNYFSDTNSKIIYNGYALIVENFRNSKSLQRLLHFSENYYENKYKNLFSEIIFFAVTSNPIALRAYYKAFTTVKPELNAELENTDLIIVSQLKKILNTTVEESENPFVLRTSLPQRYSENITIEIAKSNINESQILKNLNVDEKKGDRMLFYWKTKLKSYEI